jgi:NAD(P)-dependent dehydrogenase (short-subunit alcohol dehydrogenase family)
MDVRPENLLTGRNGLVPTELGSRGIRVSVVSPGRIKTRAASGLRDFDGLIDQARRRPFAQPVPLSRQSRRALRRWSCSRDRAHLDLTRFSSDFVTDACDVAQS